MKKVLISRFPIILVTLTLLIVTSFLRYNLYINSTQLTREFLSQNSNELYSMDTLKVSLRLNSFSKSLNWICIEGEVNSKVFYSMKKGHCESGLFQQYVEIKIPEANNTKIFFTLKTSKDLELLFIVFLLMQIGLIGTLIFATRKAEEEKIKNDREFTKLSRKMFHDIRSPLASLNTIAETTKFESQSEQDIFHISILRINEIANTLLKKTKSTTTLLPSYVYYDALLQDVIEEKRREYRNLGIQVEYNTTILAKAFLVPSEFKRIFSNLINNSVESNKESPIINITTILNNDKLELIISDNGCGIPKKIIEQLGTNEITTKKDGNGIGLKDAFESMLEWGGHLNIVETNKNGTKIKLSFLAKAETKVEKENYVLIDDDSLTRMTWESRARRSGIVLRTFSSLQEFDVVKKDLPKNTIIYIDSELGDLKGEAFALELHNEGFTNISLATGHPAENFQEFKFLKSIISKNPPFQF